MAYCDVCGNFDASHDDRKASRHSEHYRPELYYYWDYPLEEDYDWRDNFPEADCLCEICFDIANEEGKIKWAQSFWLAQSLAQILQQSVNLLLFFHL